MRPGGGKAKGSTFERKVCDMLSLWVSEGQKRDCFWRSAMSGGRSTVSLRKGVTLSRQAGDISSVSPEGHALTDICFVECKHYKDLKLDRFLFAQGPLFVIWKQVCSQAKHYSRKPVLIVRTNRLPPIVITHEDGPFSKLALRGIHLEIGQKVVIYLFEELLAKPYKLLEGK